jgi:two-component sensor histidine kinase
MSPHSPLASALQQLGAAIDVLDGAAGRRVQADKADAGRATELELMRGDRARLAEQLDEALAKGKARDALLKELSQRVDNATNYVQSALVLSSNEQKGA